MNYFDLLGIAQEYDIDEKMLRRNYLKLCQEFHPDFHVQTSLNNQQEILEKSTEINKAFEVLKDPNKRFAYILELHEALPKEGESSLSQEFLFDMMELNETMEELEFNPSTKIKQNILDKVSTLEQIQENAVMPILLAYKGVLENEGEIGILKEFYQKKQYFLRIRQNVSTFAVT